MSSLPRLARSSGGCTSPASGWPKSSIACKPLEEKGEGGPLKHEEARACRTRMKGSGPFFRLCVYFAVKIGAGKKGARPRPLVLYVDSSLLSASCFLLATRNSPLTYSK